MKVSPVTPGEKSSPAVTQSADAMSMPKMVPTQVKEETPELITPQTAADVSSVPMSVVRKRHTDAAERVWIPNHINMRVCKWFIPRPQVGPEQQQDPLCFCNYKRSKHSEAALEKALSNKAGETTLWKPDHRHTEKVPTNAYGDIEFIGYKRRAQYVKIDHETPMDRVLELMLDQWQLDPPNLLISVTGGARNFRLQPRLGEVFKRGLMKAASSTGAWIITGGMDAGVMKLVGKAVADWAVVHGTKTKVTAIGIACWGCVNNKESLINTVNEARYRVEKPRKPKHTSIDLNHSHFLLVDNGTQMLYATEIAFRAQLEKAISNMGTVTGGQNINVPVVCVVVEGGPGTLETVMRALQSGTPAVIVEGSSRAADLLAYAYWNSPEIEVEATDQIGNKVKKMVPTFDEELRKEVHRQIYAEWGDRDIDTRVNWVKECFQYRHNMTIFRLDGEGTEEIDVAILQALLKANKERIADQLKLALAWNRIDVTQSDIFTDDMRWEKGELDDVMYMALVNDRTTFVKLFLENGLSLKDFLSVHNMLKLYNETPKNSLLYSLLKKQSKKAPYFNLEDVGLVMQQLIGDFYQPIYTTDSRYNNAKATPGMHAGNAAKTCQVDAGKLGQRPEVFDNADDHKVVKDVSKCLIVDKQTGEQHLPHDFDTPAHELFIWAVLMNRFDMAMVFWEEGSSSITAALVAQKMLKSMSNEIDDSEIMQELNENIMKFSDLAVGVLSECYSADERRAGMVLVTLQENWGKTTAVQLALVADNKQFISHAACQTLLNTIWRGRVASELSMWRILLSITCPPLIFSLIKYRLDQSEEFNRRSARVRKSKLAAIKATKEPIEDSRSLLAVDEPSRTVRDKASSCLDKIIFFYNAPMVTFIHNAMFYIIFLLLYIYIMLVSFNPTVSAQECVLIVWVFTMFVEEGQVVMDESYSLRLKLLNYASDVWNIMDTISIVSFLLGLVLRLIQPVSCPACFDAARIVLSLNLMVFIYRLLHIMEYHKELGPKLVMIRRMLVDLWYFLMILIVFILAHGVALQANLYPNTPISAHLVFVNIFKKSYWQIYGELFLDELEGNQVCTNNLTAVSMDNSILRCPHNDWVGSVLLVVHIMLTNVLMLNLLIAMFSFTFTEVQEQTDQVWYFQRYSVVKEYYERPALAPPLIIVSHIYYLGKYLWERCYQCCTPHKWDKKGNDFKIKRNEDETHQLQMWEDLNQEEYIRNTHAQDIATLEKQVNATHDKVNTIMTKVEEVSESHLVMGSAPTSSSAPKLSTILDERICTLEEQMKRTSQALDWIISSMVEKGTGASSGPPSLIDVEARKKEAAQKREALEKKEKEQYKQMLQRQLQLHVKSRTKQYPCDYEIVYRFEVSDDMVEWSIEWPAYDPVEHTNKIVLDRPDWADVDLMSMAPNQRDIFKWNAVDSVNMVDRRSLIGTYQLKEGLPVNPKGRTGLRGRGLLGHWGPNHAGDPIVTRWARNKQGEQIKNKGKPVLEFVSVQREDTKQWAIPGGLIQLNQSVHEALKAEFTEEALGKLPEELRMEVKVKIGHLFQTGVEVYKGYSDDPRNTDNAWLETTALNFHDEEGILTHFSLRAGGHAQMVRWMKISTQESLYAGHIAILQKVASRLKADF